MANRPQFSAYPRIGRGALSVANTARDGSGTLVTVFTADSGIGSLVDGIYMSATSTTTAGLLRFFISDGTNSDLIQEINVTATVPSGTVAAWSFFLNFAPQILLI